MDFRENNGYNAGVPQMIKKQMRNQEEMGNYLEVEALSCRHWIGSGKKTVENHHRQIPFHLLKEVPDYAARGRLTGDKRKNQKGLNIAFGNIPRCPGRIRETVR